MTASTPCAPRPPLWPPGPALRWFSERTPLRVRLVAAMLALVALAVGVAGFAAVAALRGYLLDRVDTQLRAAAKPFARGPYREGRVYRDADDVPRAPAEYYVSFADAAGEAVGDNDEPLADGEPPDLPRLGVAQVRERSGRPYTVDGQDGQWRALSLAFPDGSGSVTLAASLADVDSTLDRLEFLEVVIGLAVLVVLGGVGYLVVRNSLRPLVAVEETAAAIAAGDLSRRVPDRHPGTEVGRLSAALNGMLAQVEAAFGVRAASEAAARASEERMRRFVADASHELRTPLTSIRGFAELYRQGAAGPDASGHVRRIEDEAVRMGLLVDDLLLLARLDQQRPLERAPVDLLSVASDTVAAARALAPDRPVGLEVLDGPAPVVLGDAARLRQVVTNLVSNALTHTPPTTPVTVRVGTRVVSGMGRHAAVEVADSGPGMSEGEAARAFQRFYRADRSRSRGGTGSGGTGLGLSIVAALVAAHGGRVDVDTAPGAGATFRVLLPLADGNGATAAGTGFAPEVGR